MDPSDKSPMSTLNYMLGFDDIPRSDLNREARKFRRSIDLIDGATDYPANLLAESFLVTNGFGKEFWPADGEDPHLERHRKFSASASEGRPLRFSDPEDQILLVTFDVSEILLTVLEVYSNMLARCSAYWRSIERKMGPG